MGKQKNRMFDKSKKVIERKPRKTFKEQLQSAKETVAAEERQLVLGTEPSVEETDAGGTPSRLLDQLMPDINKAMEPYLNEADKGFTSLEVMYGEKTSAYIGIDTFRKAMALAAKTEGHRYNELLKKQRFWEEKLSKTQIVDGVHIPKAFLGTPERRQLDETERNIAAARQQVATVIAARLGIEVDKMFQLVRKDEEIQKALNERKGR